MGTKRKEVHICFDENEATCKKQICKETEYDPRSFCHNICAKPDHVCKLSTCEQFKEKGGINEEDTVCISQQPCNMIRKFGPSEEDQETLETDTKDRVLYGKKNYYEIDDGEEDEDSNAVVKMTENMLTEMVKSLNIDAGLIATLAGTDICPCCKCKVCKCKVMGVSSNMMMRLISNMFKKEGEEEEEPKPVVIIESEEEPEETDVSGGEEFEVLKAEAEVPTIEEVMKEIKEEEKKVSVVRALEGGEQLVEEKQPEIVEETEDLKGIVGEPSLTETDSKAIKDLEILEDGKPDQEVEEDAKRDQDVKEDVKPDQEVKEEKPIKTEVRASVPKSEEVQAGPDTTEQESQFITEEKPIENVIEALDAEPDVAGVVDELPPEEQEEAKGLTDDEEGESPTVFKKKTAGEKSTDEKTTMREKTTVGEKTGKKSVVEKTGIVGETDIGERPSIGEETSSVGHTGVDEKKSMGEKKGKDERPSVAEKTSTDKKPTIDDRTSIDERTSIEEQRPIAGEKTQKADTPERKTTEPQHEETELQAEVEELTTKGSSASVEEPVESKREEHVEDGGELKKKSVTLELPATSTETKASADSTIKTAEITQPTKETEIVEKQEFIPESSGIIAGTKASDSVEVSAEKELQASMLNTDMVEKERILQGLSEMMNTNKAVSDAIFKEDSDKVKQELFMPGFSEITTTTEALSDSVKEPTHAELQPMLKKADMVDRLLVVEGLLEIAAANRALANSINEPAKTELQASTIETDMVERKLVVKGLGEIWNVTKALYDLIKGPTEETIVEEASIVKKGDISSELPQELVFTEPFLPSKEEVPSSIRVTLESTSKQKFNIMEETNYFEICECLPGLCTCSSKHYTLRVKPSKEDFSMIFKPSQKNEEVSATGEELEYLIKQEEKDEQVSVSSSCSCIHSGDDLLAITPMTSRVEVSAVPPPTPKVQSRQTIICERPKYQRTVIIVKPEAMKFKDVILRAIKQEGLDILDERTIRLTPEQVAEIYTENFGSAYFPLFVRQLSASPILVLSVGGLSAVDRWTKIIGPHNKIPSFWFYPDSIKRRFSIHNEVLNAMRLSGDFATAKNEIRYFFPLNIIEPIIIDSIEVQDYCDKFIHPTLLKALYVLIKEKPVNPLLFLAEWLLINNPFQPFYKQIHVALSPT